jgi:hypothetical protein
MAAPHLSPFVRQGGDTSAWRHTHSLPLTRRPFSLNFCPAFRTPSPAQSCPGPAVCFADSTERHTMQAMLALVARGFYCPARNCIPTLLLQNRERQGWGNLGLKGGKVGPAP